MTIIETGPEIYDPADECSREVEPYETFHAMDCMEEGDARWCRGGYAFWSPHSGINGGFDTFSGADAVSDQFRKVRA